MESSILDTSSSMGGSDEGNQRTQSRHFQTLDSHLPKACLTNCYILLYTLDMFLKSNFFCKLGFGRGQDSQPNLHVTHW